MTAVPPKPRIYRLLEGATGTDRQHKGINAFLVAYCRCWSRLQLWRTMAGSNNTGRVRLCSIVPGLS